ncbi:MAG: phosphoribosylformylglycinamidine synthase subunit PurL [Planctomycetota bacterium]
MRQTYTVTIDATGDPQGGTDPQATAVVGAQVASFRDDLYFLEIPASEPRARVEEFAESFLAGDPARRATVREGIAFPERDATESVALVARKPGVMDPIAASVEHALADSGFPVAECDVRTGRRYRFRNWSPSREELKGLIESHLANPLVDDCAVFLGGEAEAWPSPFRAHAAADLGCATVALRQADATELQRISDDGGLSLSLEELETIQAHYRQLDREPTDVELETLAQTWSEHCCHKTFTSPINYEGETIGNLLKETIFAVTDELNAPFCLSVFRDNAGVIALDDEWALTFKVETHNHPSALEPYGGAGTGIGGVIRDTLGTGLGARPILNTDVFCFGNLDTPADQIPQGSLPPRRVLQGVVSGVRDYGNRMGIPTANGAILFHPGYVGNPLVFCGSLGLIPRNCIDKKVSPGDLIVAIGGRTGRDGIHGATFSSRELTEESETLSAGAVQIGNPIEEKKVQDAQLRARDEGLYSAVTDCGAGGFSSAVGEMGEECGAEVELSNAPLKYAGLQPREIWISEAQERMVLAVPPANKERLFEILAEEEVEGCVLGEFKADGMLRLRFHGDVVAEMSMQFLHDGLPRTTRHASRPEPAPEREIDLAGASHGELLRRLMGHPTIASKEPVIRQYDHEVQGRIVLGPLTGEEHDAPNDAVALRPLRDDSNTVVVGCGIQPCLGELDAYEMGAQSVDEAVRNVVASGGNLDELALLDNFAWGNVHDPHILGAAVECSRGAADAARAYGAPFVSGKDSLHNTFRAGGVSRSIPHTLLVSAVSVVAGAPLAPSSDLKEAGSSLLLVGATASRLGGSWLQALHGGSGGDYARFDPHGGPEIARLVADWIASGKVLACHDLSEGGLSVAAAEMAIGGSGSGVQMQLGVFGKGPSDLELLFGEGPHRFLMEVREADVDALINAAEIPVVEIGRVTDDGRLSILRDETVLVDEPVAELRAQWKEPLRGVWGGVE